MPPILRLVTFHARRGEGQALAEHLLHAASLVAEARGCELWLVSRDQAETDTVRVTERWASEEQCAIELGRLGAVRVAPASVRELEAGPEGLEVLAVGSHTPGDGEMVADWWTT